MTAALDLRHVHAEPVMGTVVSLDVRGAPDALARRACEEAMAWLRDVDRRFSTYPVDRRPRRPRGDDDRRRRPRAVHSWLSEPAGRDALIAADNAAALQSALDRAAF